MAEAAAAAVEGSAAEQREPPSAKAAAADVVEEQVEDSGSVDSADQLKAAHSDEEDRADSVEDLEEEADLAEEADEDSEFATGRLIEFAVRSCSAFASARARADA